MATRGNDDKSTLPPLIPPLLNLLKLDYIAGSVVKIVTKDMGTVRGQVFQNPSLTGLKNSITLVNVIDEETQEEIPGHHTFFQREVSSVIGLEEPAKRVKPPIETIMETFVVADLKELNHLLDSLNDGEDVGCYIPGAAMGRWGNPALIVMNIQDVLVIIHFESFQEASKDAWGVLCNRFFASSKFNKIFFDSRGIVDYLTHNHETKMKRAFDLRFTDLYVKDKQSSKRVSSDHYLKAVQLTELLNEYLPGQIPPCDLEALSKSELSHFDDRTSEFLPQQKKYCALRVKYLFLLKCKITREIFWPVEVAIERKGRNIMAVENIVAFPEGPSRVLPRNGYHRNGLCLYLS